MGSSIYYAPPAAPVPAAPIKAAPVMREMGVGTDDDLMSDVAAGISDDKLEKLLRDKGLGDLAAGKGKSRRADKEVHVDRI